MSTPFTLPDLGENVNEAEILAIHVAPGQLVGEGDLLLEVETDKAAMEIPSPVTGTITDLIVKVGDFVKVGDTLVTIDRKSDNRAVSASGSGTTSSAPNAPQPIGRKKDTQTTAWPNQSSGMTDFSRWGPVERIPFRSIRRATARQMAASWAKIPHAYCHDTVDVTLLEEFRLKQKTGIAEAGGRLTMTVLAIKAAVAGLEKFPCFNASLDMESQEIVLKHYFHIGVAVDSRAGLLAPVIKNVDRKSIEEISIELKESVKRIRAGRQSKEEMTGSSFTVTNTGPLGGNVFTAIINHPEVAILGLGQARMQPRVVATEHGENVIIPRLMMPLCLGYDHRVVDGADAIRFLRSIIAVLETPDQLM
jgi:pyruvate dehydrogenase E2 component (dihydrolipoamide acetyltransferase)